MLYQGTLNPKIGTKVAPLGYRAFGETSRQMGSRDQGLEGFCWVPGDEGSVDEGWLKVLFLKGF